MLLFYVVTLLSALQLGIASKLYPRVDLPTLASPITTKTLYTFLDLHGTSFYAPETFSSLTVNIRNGHEEFLVLFRIQDCSNTARQDDVFADASRLLRYQIPTKARLSDNVCGLGFLPTFSTLIDAFSLKAWLSRPNPFQVQG